MERSLSFVVQILNLAGALVGVEIEKGKQISFLLDISAYYLKII